MLNAVGQLQNILLLGGTSEIGLAIVEEFLKRGPARVTLAARKNSPRIDAAVEEVKAAGASAVEVLDFDATAFDTHKDVIDLAFSAGDVDVAVVAFGTLGDQEELWQDQAKAADAARKIEEISSQPTWEEIFAVLRDDTVRRYRIRVETDRPKTP